MKYLSVCSGIESATVAWHQLGWTPIGFSEIEPFPSAVLAERFPNVHNYGDMTKYETWKIKPGSFDLLVGGTPCQSFSVAGLRGGLADPRGNLMFTYLKIAERFKPKWIVWENVPGVLSSNGGKDFGSFVGALGELGYGWAYRILDAQWVRTQRHPRAVPQRRRRVFVVGCLGDERRAAQVLFERESVQRNPSTRRAKGQGVAADVEEGVGGGGKIVADVATVGALCARDYKGVGNQYVQENKCIPCWWDGRDTAATLSCTSAPCDARMPDKGNFGAVLQPVGTDCYNGAVTGAVAATIGTSGSSVNASGPTVAVPYDLNQITSPINRQNRADGDPCHTLARDNAAHAAVLAYPIQDGRELNKSQNGLGIGGPGDPSYTVDTTASQAVAIHGTVIGRGNVPLVIPIMPQATQAEGWRVGKENQDGRGNGLGVGKDGDPCPTLDRSAVPAVAIQSSGDRKNPSISFSSETSFCLPENPMSDRGQAVAVAPIITATNDPSRSPQSSEITQQVAAVHDSPMVVRRLTVTECERLMGFCDGWTLIPYRGKPADQCPDGPRYKALGNSMAVNCMEWIGERIQAITSLTNKESHS